MAMAPSKNLQVFLWRATDCILYTRPFNKAKVLFVLVVVASVMCSISFAPSTCLDDKNSFLNRVFVKFSWGWTLILLFPLVALSSYIYEKTSKTEVLVNLLRVAIGHVIWYVFTTGFVLLDHAVGTCSNSEYEYQRTCYKNGGVWYGFDISGHTFLLSYCILIITEESIPVSSTVWQEAEDIILNNTTLSHLRKVYYVASLLMNILRFYAIILIVLSTLMMLTTNLYFHTMSEKILGFLMAVGCWYLTYCCMYGGVWYLPQPDHTTKRLFSDKRLTHSRNEQL